MKAVIDDACLRVLRCKDTFLGSPKVIPDWIFMKTA